MVSRPKCFLFPDFFKVSLNYWKFLVAKNESLFTIYLIFQAAYEREKQEEPAESEEAENEGPSLEELMKQMKQI